MFSRHQDCWLRNEKFKFKKRGKCSLISTRNMSCKYFSLFIVIILSSHAIFFFYFPVFTQIKNSICIFILFLFYAVIWKRIYKTTISNESLLPRQNENWHITLACKTIKFVFGQRYNNIIECIYFPT